MPPEKNSDATDGHLLTMRAVRAAEELGEGDGGAEQAAREEEEAL